MFKKNSIPTTITFVMLMVFMYALKVINEDGFYKLFVLKQNFIDFYPWQLITYIFFDNTTLFYYFFKLLIFFWFCSVLESEWGTLHFSIFLIVSIVVKSITAVCMNYFIPGINFESLLNGFDSLLNPNSLMLCLMTAFGFIYPDNKIYLFFIIPIKIKYLSIFSLSIALIHFLMIFMSGLPFIISLVYGTIYISGFMGLIVYFNRIFGFNFSKIGNPKRYKINSTINKKIIKENEKILRSNVTPKIIEDSDLPLCDEIDFDINDSYCKNCERFSRCLSRKNGQ